MSLPPAALGPPICLNKESKLPPGAKLPPPAAPPNNAARASKPPAPPPLEELGEGGRVDGCIRARNRKKTLLDHSQVLSTGLTGVKNKSEGSI